MENKKLAILGNPTRGNEVIEILEMLGGKNNRLNRLEGKDVQCFYYIDTNNNFMRLGYTNYCNPKDFIIFTLEGFLEKYPFKVGDKVLLNNQVKVIKSIRWDCKKSEIIYTLETNINGVKTEYQVFNYDLQPYKEEVKVEDYSEIYADPAIDDDSKTDTSIIVDGEKLIAPNGYTVKTATMDGNNLIVEYIKNKPQYPKTFQEYYALKYNGQINLNIGCDILHGAYSDQLECLQNLLICRDIYWEIAGVEMGLSEPWKPNFGENFIYAIGVCYGTIEKRMVSGGRGILLFPTEEMRDAFFENFKDLIEVCKELL